MSRLREGRRSGAYATGLAFTNQFGMLWLGIEPGLGSTGRGSGSVLGKSFGSGGPAGSFTFGISSPSTYSFQIRRVVPQTLGFFISSSSDFSSFWRASA